MLFFYYLQHKPMAYVESIIKGKLRVNPFEAYVGSENEEGDDTVHLAPNSPRNFWGKNANPARLSGRVVDIADVTKILFTLVLLWMMRHKKIGISVYLVERGIDMLPKPLTEDICSLRTDVERLAFSVIWEMSPEVEITSTRFTKSIIKSSPALSYVEALARMDDSRLTDGPRVTTDRSVEHECFG
ncbi:unnamed protein product [Brassica oleracea]